MKEIIKLAIKTIIAPILECSIFLFIFSVGVIGVYTDNWQGWILIILSWTVIYIQFCLAQMSVEIDKFKQDE